MLFLYDPPQPATMWMKNTFIPLDMVFISADARVQRIEQMPSRSPRRSSRPTATSWACSS